MEGQKSKSSSDSKSELLSGVFWGAVLGDVIGAHL